MTIIEYFALVLVFLKTRFPGALKALGSWLNDGTGILASSTYDAHLLLNTDIRPDQAYPDIQIGVLCAAGE